MVGERMTAMTGTSLKLLMMILMVFDHIPYFVPENVHAVFHLMTRCVAPFFVYMTVEGFLHTRSRMRYFLRLFVAAVVMYAGNALLNNVIIRDAQYALNDNIFATLAACVLCLCCFAGAGETGSVMRRVLRTVAGTIVALGGTMALEWGYIAIPMALISYCFRGKKWLRNVLYLALSAAAFFLVDFVRYDTPQETFNALVHHSQFLFILFLPFAYLYNGKKGSDSALLKYSFYAFYPLHLWIIRYVAWRLGA